MGIRGLPTVIALGLALLKQLALLSTAGAARSDDELSARRFRVSLPPSPEGGKSRIRAVSDLPPGGATFFAVQPIRGSVSYRGRVVSWDLVSVGEAQAP